MKSSADNMMMECFTECEEQQSVREPDISNYETFMYKVKCM